MPVPTLFVRNLPTSASSGRLEEIFGEIGPIKNCFVVKDKGIDKCRGFGYVTFSLEEDSQKALREIKEYDGIRIKVSLAKKKLKDKQKGGETSDSRSKQQQPKGLKKNRKKACLIIRNLSFKCSEDDVQQIFSKFGKVLEVRIPQKPDGKKCGFAFVQFKNVLEAGRALSSTNLKEIKGRQVAVDWAIAKDKYVASHDLSSGSRKEDKVEDSEPESDKETVTTPPKSRPNVKAVAEDSKSGSESEEDKHGFEDEDDDEGGSGDDDDDKAEQEEDDKSEDQADSDNSDLGSDDDDDDGDDDDDEDHPVQKRTLPSDAHEGRTVFIRNLSFDTEEEGVEKALLRFGELKYIRIVLHPDTEHSKGCAFAQFKEKEAAEKCVAVSQDESQGGGISVDGRRLNIILAVSREDAVKLKDKKVKTHTGSRNLYLAREGLIRAGTKAAEGVAPADMTKRERFEDLKRMKLRDVNVFVSKTRLCVHNLPKHVDAKQLRALCLKAAGSGKAPRITECRVMYDRKPQRGQVLGRSLGFAFVQFQQHEHALAALRHLNNNPDIFGPHKRPIVEFSLEDSRKLKMKEMRVQKSKCHAGQGQDVQQKREKRQPPAPQAETLQTDLSTTQGQQRHYLGFKTTPVVEQVELGDGKKRRKVLPLPSHRGPKIRNRDKKTRPAVDTKTQVNHLKRNQGPTSLHMKKQSGPRMQAKGPKKSRRSEDDRFEQLVAQYKKKLVGDSRAPQVKKSKWFNM